MQNLLKGGDIYPDTGGFALLDHAIDYLRALPESNLKRMFPSALTLVC